MRVVNIYGASPQYLVPEPGSNMRGLQTVKPTDMETQNEHFCDEIKKRIVLPPESTNKKIIVM